jgi:hypothetical protein
MKSYRKYLTGDLLPDMILLVLVIIINKVCGWERRHNTNKP